MPRNPDATYVSIKTIDSLGNYPDWTKLAKQKKMTMGELTEKALNILVADPDRFFGQTNCSKNQTEGSK